MTRESADTRLWREYGRDDPYFAVCTSELYRRGGTDPSAREAFFASGEEHVANVLAELRRHFSADFRPRRVLDFGSGVGRLVIPLAREADEVVGVDVAPEMNAEAARNCAERGVTNARFVLSDDALSQVEGSFDLVHSYIVFQHIPTRRGEAILAALVDRLAHGGVGAVHVTYGLRPSAHLLRRLVHAVRRRVPPARAVLNVLQGRPAREPYFPFHAYRLDRLFEILSERGVREVAVTLTDDGGWLGAMLYFRKDGEPRVS